MKKFSRKLGAIILSLALVLVIAPVAAIFAGCGENNPPENPPPEETEFTAVGVWRTTRCELRDEGEDGVLGTVDDGETRIIEGVDLFEGESESWAEYIESGFLTSEWAFQYEFLEDGSLKMWGGSYWEDINPLPEEYNTWEQVDNLIVTGLEAGDGTTSFEIQEDGSLLADLNGDGSFIMILEKA